MTLVPKNSKVPGLGAYTQTDTFRARTAMVRHTTYAYRQKLEVFSWDKAFLLVEPSTTSCNRPMASTGAS